jgi:hypothetical protein
MPASHKASSVSVKSHYFLSEIQLTITTRLALVEALENLVRVACETEFTGAEDMMVLDPGALDGNCSESLFTDGLIALQHLMSDTTIATTAQSNEGVESSNHPVPNVEMVGGSAVSGGQCNELPTAHDVVLQVPPAVVAQFGKVFVEVMVLMMMPQYVTFFYGEDRLSPLAVLCERLEL